MASASFLTASKLEFAAAAFFSARSRKRSIRSARFI
jgi:hypothetical protein